MSKSITARRLTAAALAVGALTAALAVPATAADHQRQRPSVEISDVQYNSPGRDDRSNRRGCCSSWTAPDPPALRPASRP
ncbi:hypothetical protein [Streptomyces flaveolus]|uniref:hypothetical protein n=1 Tax=Streptomyces flaveolus TaxID=67297 RepID=UPI0036FDD37C